MAVETLHIRDDFPAIDYTAWREVAERDLRGAPFDKRLVTRLYEGIQVQPLYMAEHAPATDPGLPGQGSRTRGGQAASDRHGGWDIRQSQSHPCPGEANKLLLADLAGGCSGTTLRYHPEARRSAANADPMQAGDGIHIDRVADLDCVLQNVDLACVDCGLDAGGAAVPAAVQLLALYRQRGVALSDSRLHLNIDPLASLAATGCLPGGLDAQLQGAAHLLQHLEQAHPLASVLAVSSRPYHEAGGHAVQELAAILASGVAYLRRLEELGCDPDLVAARTLLQVPVGCDQFLEIAKLRALRRVWTRLLEACGVAVPALRIQAQISARMLTRCDPWVNILRGTVAGFAAAVGGADAVDLAAYDHLLGPSAANARRLARNTQIILQEESHLGAVTDPGGGSWYVESLTEELAGKAWSEFQRIEAAGGMLSALRDRSFRDAIKEVWTARSANLGKRKDPITGVSEFPNIDEVIPERPTPSPAQLRECTSASDATASDATAVDVALDAVSDSADLAGAIAAAQAGADLADLAAALLPGDEVEMKSFTAHRFAEGFEALRQASAEAANRPTAFLANLGPVAEHTVRATWIANVVEAGGIRALRNDGFGEIAACVEGLRASGVGIVVICGTDERYAEWLPELVPALQAAGARQVLVAGRPTADQDAAWRAAGVAGFVYLGCPILELLTDLLTQEGVLA